MIGSNSAASEAIKKIKKKTAVVGVIGLGQIGKEVALLTARRGYRVVGYDKDPLQLKRFEEERTENRRKKAKLEQIDGGNSMRSSSVRSIKKYSENLSLTQDPEEFSSCSIFLLCVQTPILDKNEPDYSYLLNACDMLSNYIKPGGLVVLESTVSPGTFQRYVLPALETKGLKEGRDFWLAHCPERYDPGSKKWPIEKIPRVLGGCSSDSVLVAQEFYKQILDSEIVKMSSIDAAAAVKLVENTFRDVNIAYVNELARCFDRASGYRLDIREIIDGAATKPFGYLPFYPGPGVGGDCIPMSPHYLLHSLQSAGVGEESTTLISTARKLNDSMPEYVVSRLVEGLVRVGLCKSGTGDLRDIKIAVLGASYKPGVPVVKYSPALKIVSLLNNRNARVELYDPLIKELAKKGLDKVLDGAHAAILATPHPRLVKNIWKKLEEHEVRVLVDATNSLKKHDREKILYLGIGRN
jgi:UDP-N-acetyl-D-glucosamine dehydrogenase